MAHYETSQGAIADIQGEGGNPESLLKSRILSSDQVSRAALWDHDDFLCVASSSKAFDISPDHVRKVSQRSFSLS
jgi:hypothetical protein